MYAQLTHSIGLNDVCDALALHSGPLSSLRGGHANPTVTRALPRQQECARHRWPNNCSGRFWNMWATWLRPLSAAGLANRFARKFKRTIHLVDSTTIPLIASCLDWARHRRRKAAAKCHLRFGLAKFSATLCPRGHRRHNDAKRARESSAPESKPVKSSYLTRLMWTLHIWLTLSQQRGVSG